MRKVFLGILAITVIFFSFYIAREQILFIFREISAGRYAEIQFRKIK